MSMYQWAEQECRLACKRENPNFNFDSDNFDYGCSCYKSALKALKSLLEDEHSNHSIGFTKSILMRLIDGQPLTPITDDDFFSVEHGTEQHPLESDEYLKQLGLKSHIQCPRMSSLFREETLDGKVSYHDVDRAYYIDIEQPSDTYSTSTKFLDEMYPITMPYMPPAGKYKIYAQTFLSEKGKGDFDTKGIMYLITPSGEKVDVGIYMTEENGKMVRISKEEYDTLLASRVDKLSHKVADSLIWTLVSNSASDEEIKRREAGYNALTKEYRWQIRTLLRGMCQFFENPEHYQYNTFHVHQSLCRGEVDEFKDIPELIDIAEYLKQQLDVILYEASKVEEKGDDKKADQ